MEAALIISVYLIIGLTLELTLSKRPLWIGVLIWPVLLTAACVLYIEYLFKGEPK